MVVDREDANRGRIVTHVLDAHELVPIFLQTVGAPGQQKFGTRRRGDCAIPLSSRPPSSLQTVTYDRNRCSMGSFPGTWVLSWKFSEVTEGPIYHIRFPERLTHRVPARSKKTSAPLIRVMLVLQDGSVAVVG